MADRSQPISLVLVSPEDVARDDDDQRLDGGPWLRLEQAPLEGVASGMAFADWFAATYPGRQSASFADMMRYYEQWRSFCNEEAEFITEIRVHKSHPDLLYRLDATRGRFRFTAPLVETEEKTQTFSVRGEASQELIGEAVVNVVCAQWEGNVYTETGEQIVPRPKITLVRPKGAAGDHQVSYDPGSTLSYVPIAADDPILTNPLTGNTELISLPGGGSVTVHPASNIWTLAWGRKVIGVLKVVYVVEYDVWPLAISARTVTGDSVGSYSGEGGESSADYDGSGYGVEICTEAYDEDQPGTVYAATIYGVYAGGVETLEIETPPLEGNCDGGGDSGGSSSSDDEPDREEEECYWHIVEVDPCTNEPTGREWDEDAPCPDEEDENQGEPEEKEPTDYGPAKYWPSKYD